MLRRHGMHSAAVRRALPWPSGTARPQSGREIRLREEDPRAGGGREGGLHLWRHQVARRRVLAQEPWSRGWGEIGVAGACLSSWPNRLASSTTSEPEPGQRCSSRHPAVSGKYGGETTIEYKGYVGVFEFEELEQFHGYVLNTQDVISFYGSSVEELRAELQTSVEEYLAFCAEKGRDPEKPFSGNLSIRTSPDIHRRIAMQAARRRVSMNSFVESVLEKAVSEG